MTRTIRFAIAGLLMAQAMVAVAQVPPPPELGTASNNRPRVLEQVKIEQRLGQQLPLATTFRDDAGRTVRLGDYFGKRPVIVVFNYYTCPMLCSQVLNGLTSALTAMKFTAGQEFEVVAISIDARETAALAADAKAKYLHRYGRPAAAGWHFLTGDQAAIGAAAQAAGFHYVWDERTQQFAHGSGIMVATPEGKLAQYFYGIEFSPRDLRLAVVESSQGKVGTLVDSVLLYCYHYDPTAGKYGAVVMNMMRVGALLTLFTLGGFMLVMFRREHRMAGREGKSA
jgi:protein SCO1/2